MKDSLKLIEGFTIPTRPTVMLQAIKTQNAFVPDPRDVTAIILQDMALAATVLQTANTLLAGHTRQVHAIECAIVLLGQEKLREITQELFMTARITGKGSLMQKVRAQGVRTARVLAWVSQEIVTLSPSYKNKNLPILSANEAYVVGLLHDCGQLVLLQRFPDYPTLMANRDTETQTLEDAETEHYQTNHAVLGALLCEAWKLPKSLAQVIKAHHHIDVFAVGKPIKERKFAVMHALLFLAEFLEGEISEWEWRQGQDYFCQFFDMDASQIASLRQKAQALFPLETPLEST